MGAPVSTYKANLDGCWAKINRAQEHRDTLEANIAETFAVESNLPGYGAQFEANTGDHVLRVNHLPDLRLFLTSASLCLGDIIHNLRSCLDHLAFQLALQATNNVVKYTWRVQFPIEDCPSDFQDRCKKKGSLAEIDPRHQAIIEGFQPYHRFDLGGSYVIGYFHALTMLRDLSNTDKHQLLNPMMMPSGQFQASGGKTSALINLLSISRRMNSPMPRPRVSKISPMELGTEISRAKLPDGWEPQEVDVAGYIVPTIAFNDGRPVIHVVDKINAMVVKIVSEFKAIL